MAVKTVPQQRPYARAAAPASSDWALALRRQPNDIVRGRVHDGYTNAFEVICPSCGDLAEVEYRDTPPRIQRLRGPYRLTQGVTAYVAHLEWHERNRPLGPMGAAGGCP
jgi:hypothetical protein